MHGVDGATGCIGSHRGKEGRVEDPEPNLLAFHVAAGTIDSQMMHYGISGRLRSPTNQQSSDEENGHRHPDRPSVSLVFDHSPKVVSEGARDGKNREDLN